MNMSNQCNGFTLCAHICTVQAETHLEDTRKSLDNLGNLICFLSFSLLLTLQFH